MNQGLTSITLYIMKDMRHTGVVMTRSLSGTAMIQNMIIMIMVIIMARVIMIKRIMDTTMTEVEFFNSISYR
jgi:hypothetical protein